MISLLCKLINKVLNMLPGSPLKGVITALTAIDDMMGYLNWFIPFKACFVIMSSWCAAMAVWYVYKHVKNVIFKLV